MSADRHDAELCARLGVVLGLSAHIHSPLTTAAEGPRLYCRVTRRIPGVERPYYHAWQPDVFASDFDEALMLGRRSEAVAAGVIMAFSLYPGSGSNRRFRRRACLLMTMYGERDGRPDRVPYGLEEMIEFGDRHLPIMREAGP